MSADLQQFLTPTRFIDADHTAVMAYAHTHSVGAKTDSDKAIRLYYRVRDDFRYNPYSLDLSIKGMQASTVLANGEGWCVNKAVLLTACCRALGIPARLGFADVVNHLTSEKLLKVMQSNVFKWHGYSSIFLNNQWVKATPAFNIELCEKAGIHPLEFDGMQDSIYHEFDKAGNKHMEYQHYRGEHADLPLQEMTETFERDYAFNASEPMPTENFHDAVAREHASSQRTKL